MGVIIHSPQTTMGGEQVIRISNQDRPTKWITFHFASETDATEAFEKMEGALLKADKVEWP